MRDGGLERVEAVVQRQQRVPPKGNDDRLFLEREHRRLGLLGSGGPVGNRATLLPLGDGLWIDAVAPGQHPQALLTMLDCSTHRRRRAGAPMQNLAHSASFHSDEKSAPSKPGTKQLSGCETSLAAATTWRALGDDLEGLREGMRIGRLASPVDEVRRHLEAPLDDLIG